MKFFLPILLAAPAVMGRACKVRHSHSSAVEPVHTQYPVPEPVISQAPTVVSQKSSPVEVKTTASKPKTSKSKTTKPKKVSKPKASKPKASKPKSTTTKTTKPSAPKTSTPKATSTSKSTPLGNGASVSGSSTFYGGNLAGGNCMFSTYTLPSDILGTAFSGQKWDNAANCGACIEVTGPSGTIKAMIVDKCPECDLSHLDLFPDAFKAVGGTDGIVKTSYKFVECGITTPLVLHNKEGTSANWFSIQVVNANEPVKSVQVSTDGGSTWKSTERKDYNFFENPAGFGKTSVDVKVTSSTGKSVVVKNVGVTAGAQYKASSNF
ncbi:extracellular cellulase [Fusarium denticulatum]|uniref:Extracellular cellulase n=1 Tax=Fusarium denticulatum TaxID=48507 RepID=A0A8H5WZJ4_9HYPO|nr:extracellular cellulase [Fusarium denticulatum]